MKHFFNKELQGCQLCESHKRELHNVNLTLHERQDEKEKLLQKYKVWFDMYVWFDIYLHIKACLFTIAIMYDFLYKQIYTEIWFCNEICIHLYTFSIYVNWYRNLILHCDIRVDNIVHKETHTHIHI